MKQPSATSRFDYQPWSGSVVELVHTEPPRSAHLLTLCNWPCLGRSASSRRYVRFN